MWGAIFEQRLKRCSGDDSKVQLFMAIATWCVPPGALRADLQLQTWEVTGNAEKYMKVMRLQHF